MGRYTGLAVIGLAASALLVGGGWIGEARGNRPEGGEVLKVGVVSLATCLESEKSDLVKDAQAELKDLVENFQEEERKLIDKVNDLTESLNSIDQAKNRLFWAEKRKKLSMA